MLVPPSKVQALIEKVPELDFMMAETLLMAHANGTLPVFPGEQGSQDKRGEVSIKAIEIEHARERKIAIDNKCEETLAD